MRINHIALVCSSEEKSDRFYSDVLGLNKMQSKIVPPVLSKKLFGIEKELKIVNYGNDHMRFEIFIFDQTEKPRIPHICLEVDNLDALIDKCRDTGTEVLKISKNGGFIIFIKDYDANAFEIKQK